MERNRSSSPETGSTSHGSSGTEYDVFLSFRGPDTRANFTDSLYHTLLDKGISVFIDKKGIDVGEEIGPEIFQAIEDSKICIPIFSRDYATSSWCLRELEHMMQRRKTNELEVLPVFYDVEPSDVKLETEVYRNALTLHKKKRGAEIVQRWEEALKEVTGIKGWDTKNKGHGELAHVIARKVLGKLKVSCVHISDHLVGMDESVNKVVDLLDVESKDIRLIGIWGMGGIGKTTLAKVVYDQLSNDFDSCSFISDIREASQGSNLSNVQRRLVSDIIGDVGVGVSSIDHGKNMIKDRFCRKKVLIFLDDVDHASQLRALAAKKEWFGSGSRIVVTTRDRSVFSEFRDQFDQCLIYEVEELDNIAALQLFSYHAFRSNSPPSAFSSLSKKVIAKAGGLPLAIEVIGSFLCGKTEVVMWQDTLQKMEHFPRNDVKEKLMLSYEALDLLQQQIFLDIACFLAGEDKSYAYYMWDDCGFFPNEGVDVLLLMSLVKIEEGNRLWMHDQLKDLGRSIMYQEYCKDPKKGSQAWNQRGPDIVQQRKGIDAVAAFCLKGWPIHRCILTSEDFIKVPNIRFLKMFGGTLSGDFEDLFSELRWLSWNCCPKEMEATNFCLKNLVILDLSLSSIDERWGGWTQFKVATRLKVLNLSYCHNLSITPDLSTYISLEILILRKCESLLRIDRSIGHLRLLKHLNLIGCSQLQVLPVELGSLEALTELLIENYNLSGGICRVPSSIGALVNLERLVLFGAIKLTTLPDSIGMLKGLVELDVSLTGIVELPSAVVNLKSLKVLKISISHMQKLPKAIGMLEKLEEIYGVGCTMLKMIPSDIVRLPSLKTLILTETCVEDVPELPRSLVIICLSSRAAGKASEISNLVNLRNMDLSFTIKPSRLLEVSTYGPWCKLELQSITSVSLCMGCLCCLKELELNGCKNLRHIRQLPSSLRKLTVKDCNLLEVFDLSNLESLLELTLNEINILDLEGLTSLQHLRVCKCRSSKFSGLERLENLRLLYFVDCGSLQTLPDLSNLKNLKDFTLQNCPKLVEIEGLDKLESLESLSISGCSLQTLPDLSNLKNLKVFTAWECLKLVEIEGLDKLESLENLSISGCSLQTLPDLSNLKNLKDFTLQNCPKLVEIGGLDKLELLESLSIGGCSLQTLPNLSNLKNLKYFRLRCPKLVKIEGLDKLESLENLSINGCSLQTLPDLSNLKNLKDFEVRECSKLVEIEGLDKLESLEILSIDGCSLRTLPCLSNLKKLKDFKVHECSKLVEIEGLDKLESLEILSIGGCSLQTLPDLSNLKNLKVFEAWERSKLIEIEGLDKLESLESLLIGGCSLQTLPDLSNLKNLKVFKAWECSKLIEIEGLDKLESLENLWIHGCSLQTLPNLSNLKNLKDFEVRECSKLVEIEGLDKLESLESLWIGYCSSLRSLPDLSHLKKLKKKWCDAYLISHWST